MNTYRHNKTGNDYELIAVANSYADISRKDEYPSTAVYKDRNGYVWARPLADFLGSFTQILDND